jgi:hypothetical protein
MEDLEDVTHHATQRTMRFVDVPHHADLTLIEPDAVAIGTRINFHILEIALDQVSATLWTLHEMLAALNLETLLVEEHPHLFDQLSILTCKILVLVPCWMIFRVTVHESSTP